MTSTSILLAGLAGVLSFSAPAWAQEPAAAQPAHAELLNHMQALVQKPFECDLNMEVQAEQAAQATGHVLWGGPGKLAMNLSMTLPGPTAGSEGGKFSLRMVGNGTDLFVEAVQGGQTQAFKLPISILGDADTLNSMTGGALDLEEIHSHLQELPLSSEVKNGLRQYKAEVELGEDMGGKLGFALDLDEKTWFPQSLRIDVPSEDASVNLRTSNVSFPETVAAEKFQYTAPEGVFVMDLAALMGGGADAGAEDEF